MTPALLAPEIDRLVWAVNFRARDFHVDYAVFSAAGLPDSVFGTLNNLIPFLDKLTEPFVFRRYIYRPPEMLSEFVTTMLSAGAFTRKGDRLEATPLLDPVRDALSEAVRQAAHHFWDDHGDAVEAASGLARRVLEASPPGYDLAQAAITSPEPDDSFHRFHQRLAGLRLLRNEAHVQAWRALDLSPSEIEMLSSAWAGSPAQTPVLVTDPLEDRGWLTNGAVNAAGLAARQAIEDATNEGVDEAFSVIDQSALYTALMSLPPETP